MPVTCSSRWIISEMVYLPKNKFCNGIIERKKNLVVYLIRLKVWWHCSLITQNGAPSSLVASTPWSYIMSSYSMAVLILPPNHHRKHPYDTNASLLLSFAPSLHLAIVLYHLLPYRRHHHHHMGQLKPIQKMQPMHSIVTQVVACERWWFDGFEAGMA